MVDKMYFQVVDHFLPVQKNICLNCLYASSRHLMCLLQCFEFFHDFFTCSFFFWFETRENKAIVVADVLSLDRRRFFEAKHESWSPSTVFDHHAAVVQFSVERFQEWCDSVLGRRTLWRSGCGWAEG